MNRKQCEKDNLLLPFKSANERRLVKMHRRKLRRGLALVAHTEGNSRKKEYSKKLKAVRERIARSRPVRIETVKDAIDVLKIRNQWTLIEREAENCHMRRIPSEYRARYLRPGCSLEDPEDKSLYAFDIMDIVYDSWRFVLCPFCYDMMVTAHEDVWERFFSVYKYMNMKIDYLLPFYIDFKRINISASDLPTHADIDLCEIEKDEIEEISEDEDDGKTVQYFEGKVTSRYLSAEQSRADQSDDSDDTVDYDLLVRQMQ